MKHNVVRFFSIVLIMCTVVILSAGSLTVTASSGTTYESEPNNTVATADMTYDDYDSYGYISSTSDVDWWKVTFSSEGIANFYLGSIPSGCDYQLRVYNYTGNKLLVESLKTSNSSELCKVHVRAGEAYYIKIYSASGCSTTDSYKFRFKRYNLNGARTFTCQYTNNGDHYSGACDWNAVLSTMGYSSSVLLEKNAAYVYSYMPNYSLVLFNTHGDKGEVYLHSSAYDHTTLYAKDFSSMPTYDRAVENYSSSSSLSNDILVVYKACQAGATDLIGGNMVYMTLDKGAFCCLGWPNPIWTTDGNLWVEKFLEYCASGENIGNARALTNRWVNENTTYFSEIYDFVIVQTYGSSRLFAALIG